ncbi:MAG: hypothetical protein J6O17_06510 [Eubacterium sp.]|nr:hypothetical protein [Eubacterium sp.]
MKVICQHCGNKFDYHMYVGLCPKCGKIYRTRSETVEHNSGIVLNATYSTEDIHPELEEYWNRSFNTHNHNYQAPPQQVQNAYPEKMYQKTQLNKAYRPPQAMIRTSNRPQPKKQGSGAALFFIVVIIMIIMFMYALAGNF